MGRLLFEIHRLTKTLNRKDSFLPMSDGFVSFATDSLFFGFSTSPNLFTIYATDLRKGQIIDQVNFYKDKVQDQRVYFYDSKGDRRSREGTLEKTIKISNAAHPVIIVQKITDGKYNITFGTVFVDKRYVGPMVGPTIPFMLVTFIVNSAIMQAR